MPWARPCSMPCSSHSRVHSRTFSSSIVCVSCNCVSGSPSLAGRGPAIRSPWCSHVTNARVKWSSPCACRRPLSACSVSRRPTASRVFSRSMSADTRLSAGQVRVRHTRPVQKIVSLRRLVRRQQVAAAGGACWRPRRGCESAPGFGRRSTRCFRSKNGAAGRPACTGNERAASGRRRRNCNPGIVRTSTRWGEGAAAGVHVAG